MIQAGLLGAVAQDPTYVFYLHTAKHPHRVGLTAHLHANGLRTAVDHLIGLQFLAAYQRFNHRGQVQSECM